MGAAPVCPLLDPGAASINGDVTHPTPNLGVGTARTSDKQTADGHMLGATVRGLGCMTVHLCLNSHAPILSYVWGYTGAIVCYVICVVVCSV